MGFNKILLLLLSLCLFFGCQNRAILKGKVLHIPLKDSVKTSDPTNIVDTVSQEVTAQIYQTPYQYFYYKDNAEPIPDLANGMPQISSDGKTYIIKIKKGLHFQDDPCFKASQGKGREVKASDFIYGWKRHANPDNESQGFWVWDKKIVGINDFQKKFSLGKPVSQVMDEEVEGFKALDDYTIQIKILKPYPQLIHVLTMPYASPIAHEAVEMYGRDFINHPVGTGPFKALSWNPTSQIVLVKNENFNEEYLPDFKTLPPKYAFLTPDSGKRLPLIDGIEFTVVKEEQPRWLGFMNGKYDQLEIPKDNFNSAVIHDEVTAELKAKGIYLSFEPAYTFRFITFNMKDKTLGSNKYLRQAIASAIDAKQWLHLFLNDRGDLQTEVNPPTIQDRCGKPYRWTYDVERAKKLLVKAGYPGGKGLPALIWDTRGGDQTERQIGEFIQKNLADIGIHLEVVMNTFPSFLDKTIKGNLQIFADRWVMDYPDAEDNMQLLYGPNGPPGPNSASFNNLQYNMLYEQMAVLSPSSKRQNILCKMEEVLQEEVPWAYGFYEKFYRLVQGRVKGYHTAELVYNKYKYINVVDIK